jgi:hypothetical protein
MKNRMKDPSLISQFWDINDKNLDDVELTEGQIIFIET